MTQMSNPSAWNPGVYLGFADERSRPFHDLLSRVRIEPRTVLDLGCGPGHLSAVLRRRWPGAAITGIDSSPEMIASATEADPDGTYLVGDLTDYRPADKPDLIVSNAALQWVPDHLRQLPMLADRAAGTFAFQVPGNHDAPSHLLLREVAGRVPYADVVGPVERRATADPADYLDVLTAAGWEVDAWETTYLHVLQGADPVFEWISATAARPVLGALTGALRERFEDDYRAALRAAYPAHNFGTLLPFRRIFVIATRTD